MILGKPYAGKLHVRFDEGEEEDKAKKMWLDPLPLAFFFSTLPLKDLFAKDPVIYTSTFIWLEPVRSRTLHSCYQ